LAPGQTRTHPHTHTKRNLYILATRAVNTFCYELWMMIKEYVIRRQSLGHLELGTLDDGRVIQQDLPASVTAVVDEQSATDQHKPPAAAAAADDHHRRHSGSRSTVKTEFSRYFEFDDQPDTLPQTDAADDARGRAQVTNTYFGIRKTFENVFILR